jgi:acetyltransferase-like isoleucine patch superfamily enzyme
LKKWKKPKIVHNVMTRYNYLVQYPENLELGENFDIGEFSYINANYNITIEDFVQIGSHCSVYSNSTIDNKSGPVVLKKNCKIGTHSTIMPNVTVGENSVVAAYSFVTIDIPENELWGGVPAVKIKELEN